MPAIAELVDRTLSTFAKKALPESTYRLQFHAGFTFRDAAQISSYLRDLGVTHCYASPYLRAKAGSTHGYDIIDHNLLNPEIGNGEDYRAWITTLKEAGLGQILDTVPNHMGVATSENAWWNDVLENGPASRFGVYFDIAWRASPRAELRDRVLLPVLGDPYGEVLESGQLQVSFSEGAFFVSYFDRRFPIAARSYARILSHRLEELKASLGSEAPQLLEYLSVVTAASNLPASSETDLDKITERAREKEIIKRRLAVLVAESQPIFDFIQYNVTLYNGRKEDPQSFALLDELLENQCYRLSYWRVAPDEINYRRFFDINDLAALSMERQEVFNAAHGLVLQLLADGTLHGLRIDHPDGLYDPAEYLLRLQESFLLASIRNHLQGVADNFNWGEQEVEIRELIQSRLQTVKADSGWPLYVVAEKILGTDEPLVPSWAVHGTSGYDFVNMANGLFVDPSHADAFTKLYENFIDDNVPFPELVYQKKLLVLNVSLASELHMLTDQLDHLAQKDRRSRDFTYNTLRRALREVIACFPVYRSYIDDAGVHDVDRRYVNTAIARAIRRNPILGRSVFRFIRSMLLLEYPPSFSEQDQAEQRRFAGKFQQVTAPVTAKGIEDTAFYIYNRLVSLNEVGGDPDRFGVAPRELHAYNADRQRQWPYALSPLSTHDTKRSEDVRARLNVLSELPEEWSDAITRWSQLNEAHRQVVDDVRVPDANAEYLLYQAIISAWPLEPCSSDEYSRFVERISAYMEKALHEAKVHTSWINPNADYDKAIALFVRKVLDNGASKAFLADMAPLRQRVSRYGLYNSLAQNLLKLTSPGVPDTYQGTEIWDFSLVDPDNRRPVDYQHRASMLRQLLDEVATEKDLRPFCERLLETMIDGRCKMYLTFRALHCRRERPGLFSQGEYLPLEAVGPYAEHVFAFARRSQDELAIVVVPRLLTKIMPDPESKSLDQIVWGHTAVNIGELEHRTRWRSVFTGEEHSSRTESSESSLPVSDLLRYFPCALLVRDGTS